jgi:DNA polymerase-3 subunit epsilon
MLKKILNWSRRRPVTASQAERLERLPAPPSLGELGEFDSVRLVVVDLETSGLNTQKDLVLAIGAVAIERGSIDLADQFEAVLHQPGLKLDDTVLIHGLGPESLASGITPEDGLLDFLEWAGAAVFVAFHSPFDQKMLERSLRAELGLSRKHIWLDMADVLPALFTGTNVGPGQLDDWLDHFRLNVSNRHNAAADALATAELMLIAVREARAQAVATLPQLEEKTRLFKRLQTSRHHL